MTRDGRRVATRRALAEAALNAFLVHGVNGVTVGEIASAAGVSPRTFFLHFPSKAAAAFPDHEEKLEAFRAALAELPVGGDELANVCALMVRAVRTQAGDPFRRHRYALVRSAGELRDIDARNDRDYEEALSEHLRGRWGDGPETALRSEAIANVVVGVARAALFGWGRDRTDPAEATRCLLDRLLLPPLHSLAGRPPPPADAGP